MGACCGFVCVGDWISTSVELLSKVLEAWYKSLNLICICNAVADYKMQAGVCWLTLGMGGV